MKPRVVSRRPYQCQGEARRGAGEGAVSCGRRLVTIIVLITDPYTEVFEL
jgi:hypothetical protein